MNSGIYSLKWADQNLIYVGLSQDISRRFRHHTSMFENNKHTNYKLQNAYNQYGMPELEILELCSIELLATREVYWCNKLDALGNNGLCLVEPGIVGHGTNSNYSKYSKFQILRVFSLLYKGKHSQVEIEQLTKVKQQTVKDITNGISHLWLKEKYKEKYEQMLKIDRKHLGATQKSRTLKGYLVTPEQEIVPIYSCAEFVKRKNPGLDQKQVNAIVSGLCRLLRGERLSYKGYKRYTGVVA